MYLLKPVIMILSTSHDACNILADLLIAHGTSDIVVSPGSRNSPLIMALSRRPELKCHPVIDERSAAFIALGLSRQTFKPVAVVCTSGTALLNYAPAVAEAFYSTVPLIVISADRPEEWIDQDDSQTLWQQNVLADYVKRRADIPAHLNFDNASWWVSRLINDALLEAVNGRQGPVHINIRLDAPLNRQAEWQENKTSVIRMVTPPAQLPVARIRELATPLRNPRRLMVIAGFHRPDSKLNRALGRLAALPNVVVLTETISNLHNPLFVSRIDSTLCRMSEEEKKALRPDTVITVGGALVSRHIKEWMRSLAQLEHWHVGYSHTTIDSFRRLTMRINMDETPFLSQLASAMQPHGGADGQLAPCDYASRWQEIARRAALVHQDVVDRAPWSTLKAFATIIKAVPPSANLHLSNGTSIRYAQLMDCSQVHRCECNRGVSGIDGSTSTALGASVGYRSGSTVLITGDMSMQYDIAALSSLLLNPRFKIIVICNDGGEIFRFISATASLPELEKYLVVGTRLPLSDLCRGYGLRYFTASSESQLRKVLPEFFDEHELPALLAVNTPGAISAEVLRSYFGPLTFPG